MSNFFLHVQGSGYLEFEGGERLLLAYGGKNGRNYTSIGRILVESGAIPKAEISMQAIKVWAASHPEQVEELLYQCESYTFFRTGPTGPVGAGGEVVVPELSVAVDPKIIPLGAVLLAHVPSLDGAGRLSGHEWRLLLAQDTGAAIKGPGHIDLYVGAGPKAGDRAGRLHHYGSVWMLRGLLPNE
jgi:membrane-bound lytic murein transglycosylase A